MNSCVQLVARRCSLRRTASFSAWGWLIDVSGLFLVLLSLTGLGLLFYLKKVRLRALAVMAGGTMLVVVLARLVM